MVQERELAVVNVLPSDTIGDVEDTSADTIEAHYGILLTPPPAPSPRPGGSIGVSFILSGLFLLFLIIALRFRNNIKYVVTMFRNLVETRTRHNVFDDTVRETSLIVMLNVLWCCCAGIIGFCVYQYLHPEVVIWEHRAVGMLLGMAIAAVYILFMWGMYGAVGWIFSDGSHAEMWIKGFAASQALMAPAFFVTALLGICRPDIALDTGAVSAAVFILVKLVFLWKGFRIFFNQFSSWVLFLCYLCSLEIVPLILCYRCAVLLGEVL